MPLEAYADTHGEPIPEAILCTRCQGGTYQRLRAYNLARASGIYNDGGRIDITGRAGGLVCLFCGGDGTDDDDE